MIRRAEERDLRAMMEIYNDAVLHTAATFDTETKSYDDRLAWFRAHTGRYVILVRMWRVSVCTRHLALPSVAS